MVSYFNDKCWPLSVWVWHDMLSFEGVEDTTLALHDEEDLNHNPGFNH